MKIVLCQLSPKDSSATTKTIRLCSASTPARIVVDGVQYIPAVTAIPEREISIKSSGGELTYSGSLDFSIMGNTAWAGYHYEDMAVTIWIGDHTATALTSFTKVYDGLGGKISIDGQIAKLTLKGAEGKLATNLLTATYAGTGGAEGHSDFKGRLKPWASGTCANIPLDDLMIDNVNLVFQYHGYGATQAVDAVYENALTLGAATATVNTYAELIALTLAEGQWAAAPAVGMIRLGAEPTGLMTADIKGAKSGASFPSTIGTIATHLMGLAGVTNIGSSVTAFTDTWNVFITDQVEIGEVVREAFLHKQSYIFAKEDGQFIAGSYITSRNDGTLKTGGTRALPYVATVKQLENPAIIYRVKIGHSRNWMVHSADEVSDALKEGIEAAVAAANDAQSAADAAAADAAAALAAANNKVTIDVTPPNQVGGVAASSAITLDTTGNQIVTMTVTWTASTASDLSHYIVTIAEGSASTAYTEIQVGRTSTSYVTQVTANMVYKIKVRAVDLQGNVGSWSTEIQHTASRDTTPPAAPTALAATAFFTGIRLNWTSPSDLDVDRVEIYENTTNNSGTAIPIDSVIAVGGQVGYYTRSGLGNANTRYYWVKAVDTSGNKSAFSTGVSATTIQVAPSDLSGLISDSQISALAATKITGQIIGTQITDGAISTPKLAAGSVTTAVLAAGSVVTSKLAVIPASICPDPYFNDIDFWSNPWDANGWYAEENPSSTNGLTRYVALWAGHATNNPTTNRRHIWSRYVDCPPVGTVLRLRARIQNDSNQIIYVEPRFYNSANTSLGSGGAAVTAAAASGVNSYTVQVTVPSGAERLQFIIYNQGSTTFTNAAIVGGIVCDVAATADLLVDGQITAAKIATDTITANQIAAGTITGAEIAANTITVDKLTVTGGGNVAANQIANGIYVGTTGTTLGTIQSQANDPASRVNAQSTTIQPGKITISGATTLANWRNSTDTTKIEGGSIATNTITATQIAAGAITASEIAAGAITADKIASGQIFTQTLYVGNAKIILDGPNARIIITD